MQTLEGNTGRSLTGRSLLQGLINKARDPRKLAAIFAGVLLMAVFLAPFLWMLATSLKSNHDIFNAAQGIGGLIPQHFNWSNYRVIFTEIPYTRYLLNSLLVALASSFLETLLAALAAYGLGVLSWKFRSVAYWFLALSWLVPFSVVLIPRFLIFAYAPDYLWPSEFWSSWRVISLAGTEFSVGRIIGLDSFIALIIPGSISITATFLLITAMKRIPLQLLETAYLDVGSSIKIFWSVVLPLIKPTLITVAFFAFLSSWQGFTWPLVITSTLEMQTAPIGLRAFQSLHSTQWPLLMAGSVILTLPSLAFLFLAQRYVIDGFQMTGFYEHRI